MALPPEKRLHTLDEYFSLTDQEGEIRYEYYFGKIVAMAGALLRHNLVSGNALGAELLVEDLYESVTFEP